MLCFAIFQNLERKKPCTSQFCSVHGWLFRKNRSSMSSEDRRSNIPVPQSSQPWLFHFIFVKYTSAFHKSRLALTGIMCSCLLGSPYEICLQLFGKNRTEQINKLFCSPQLGIIQTNCFYSEFFATWRPSQDILLRPAASSQFEYDSAQRRPNVDR